jgi:HEAT repeat protein
VAASALLAFGAMGAEASPEMKAYVRGELQAELAAADTPASLRTALQAIGNTGDRQVLDAAAEYLEAPDPALRAAAASALRGMGRDAVEPLQTALEAESSRPAAAVMARTLAQLGAPSATDVAWAGKHLAAVSDAMPSPRVSCDS